MPFSDDEWKGLLELHDFGQLIVPGPSQSFPVVVPTHFIHRDREILLHVAKANPVLGALQHDERAMFAVIGPYAYVESSWNTPPEYPAEYGIPTSYYAAVQLEGRATIVQEPTGIAEILNLQMAHFEPGGPTSEVSIENDYGPLLAAIRGIRFQIDEVRAKFKFGGNRTPEHQLRIVNSLRKRGQGLDHAVADIQLARLSQTFGASRQVEGS